MSAISAADLGMAAIEGMTYSPCTSYLQAHRQHSTPYSHTFANLLLGIEAVEAFSIRIHALSHMLQQGRLHPIMSALSLGQLDLLRYGGCGSLRCLSPASRIS